MVGLKGGNGNISFKNLWHGVVVRNDVFSCNLDDGVSSSMQVLLW